MTSGHSYRNPPSGVLPRDGVLEHPGKNPQTPSAGCPGPGSSFIGEQPHPLNNLSHAFELRLRLRRLISDPTRSFRPPRNIHNDWPHPCTGPTPPLARNIHFPLPDRRIGNSGTHEDRLRSWDIHPSFRCPHANPNRCENCNASNSSHLHPGALQVFARGIPTVAN